MNHPSCSDDHLKSLLQTTVGETMIAEDATLRCNAMISSSLHLDGGLHSGWYNWIVIEETKWSTTSCCALKANEASLTPTGAPAVLDLPEVGTVTRGQHSMVQTAH